MPRLFSVRQHHKPKRQRKAKPAQPFPFGRIVTAKNPKAEHYGEIREGVPDDAERTTIAAIKRTSFTAAMEGDSAFVLEIEPRIGDAKLTSQTMGRGAFDKNNPWFIVGRDVWVSHKQEVFVGHLRRVEANCRSASVIGIAVSTRSVSGVIRVIRIRIGVRIRVPIWRRVVRIGVRHAAKEEQSATRYEPTMVIEIPVKAEMAMVIEISVEAGTEPRMEAATLGSVCGGRHDGEKTQDTSRRKETETCQHITPHASYLGTPPSRI
jgi:hypothetical protein